ncbi:expressed unknown protein [Seminavis robusta]|uniref:Uncharacterized protein n=1 Tax=Seminavis robusta TaxID=568900 RepID=A0A9N8E861_9STRA|nr:expressed unknown protein [Seminavis robusta]|eukprot:Sro616_g175971.1  (601) ;mRNA; r:28885-30687
MKFSSSIMKLLSWSWTTDNNSNTTNTPVLQVAKDMTGNNNNNKDVPAAEEVPTFQLDELDKSVIETAALLHGEHPDVEFQQHGRYLGAYDLSLVPTDQHGHYGYDKYNQHRPKGCRIQPSQSANARWKTHYGQDTERSNGNRLSFAPVNTVVGYSSGTSEQKEKSDAYGDVKKHEPQARYEFWHEAQQQFISVGTPTPHERVLDLVQLIQEYGYQQVAKWITNNKWFQSDNAYLRQAKLYIQIDAVHQDLEALVKFIQAKKGNNKQVAHWFMVNEKNTYMFELAMCHLHHGGIQRNADEICTLNTREQIANRRFVYRKVKDVCMEDAAGIVVEQQPTTAKDIEAIEQVSTVDDDKMASDATITCEAAVVPTCTAVVPYIQKWHVAHFKISVHGQQPFVMEMRMMNGALLGVVPNDILAALMKDAGDLVKEFMQRHKTLRLEAGVASDDTDFEFVTGQVEAEEPLVEVEVEEQQQVDAEEPLVDNRVDEEDNVDTAQSTLRRSKRRMAAIASQRIAEQIKTKPRRVAEQQPRINKGRRAAATKKKSTKPKAKGKNKSTKPKAKGKKKKTTPVTDTQQETTVQTTTSRSGRRVRKPDRYIPV